ncbi:MAG: hypothetical protein WCC87_03355 [Candidatus Korobacteraceae bacterium]
MGNSSYIDILFTALGGIDGSVMPIIWFIANSILAVTFLWGVYDAFVRGGDVRSLGIAEQVLSQTLLNAKPVNAVGIRTQKNRVNVRLEDVARGKDAIYVRYQVTNLSTVPYRIIAPSVSVLTAAGTSMPDANLQLGAGYLEAFGKMSIAPIELLHSEIDQQDVAPGKTSTGVLAIRSSGGSPQIYQFVFGSDNISPIVTAAVL